MNISETIKNELIELKNEQISIHSQRFFKTGKGEYGEGDKFLGIRVPVLRKISKKYIKISLTDIEKLITSEYHEIRLISLFIMVLKFKNAKHEVQKEICQFYLKNAQHVNNWDLVDSSAHYIVGPYLRDKDKEIIYKFAQSDNLWERRIAIMTTYHFIKNNEFSDTLNIAKILLHDQEDLIHKAVGWMLREIGNRDKKIEEIFLLKYYNEMPRTMLRYAIEKFPKEERIEYLKGLK